MLRNKLFTVFVAAIALILVSDVASANDQDVWTTTVPATSCEPINSSHAAEVRLSNGAWVFRGNNTGTIQFYCPLPLNAFTKSDFSHDNDITNFRIYYRDSDATSNAARVTARLVYRQSSGLFSGGSTWSSNCCNVTSNTTRTHNNPHDVRSSALYSFYVTMTRTNTTQAPAFSGIDFPFPQVP